MVVEANLRYRLFKIILYNLCLHGGCLMLCFIRCFFLANNLHNGDLGPTYNHGRSRSGAEDHSEPPRPPPPRPEGTDNTKYDIINDVSSFI